VKDFVFLTESTELYYGVDEGGLLVAYPGNTDFSVANSFIENTDLFFGLSNLLQKD